MESYNKKLMFITLRADNLSLARIASELGVSKRTCSNWEKEFKLQISEERKKRYNECNDLYFIQREARIKRLSDTLKRIDNELCNKDFSEVSTEDLLKLKLKYESELAKENSNSSEISIEGGDSNKLKRAISNIHSMVADGTISGEQAKLRLDAIRIMIQANKQAVDEW